MNRNDPGVLQRRQRLGLVQIMIQPPAGRRIGTMRNFDGNVTLERFIERFENGAEAAPTQFFN